MPRHRVEEIGPGQWMVWSPVIDMGVDILPTHADAEKLAGEMDAELERDMEDSHMMGAKVLAFMMFLAGAVAGMLGGITVRDWVGS